MGNDLYYAAGMFLNENSFKSTIEEALERSKDMFWMDDDYIVVFKVEKIYNIKKDLEEANISDVMLKLKEEKEGDE